MKQLPDESKQAEMIRQVEIAEQKMREMAEFADQIAKKWEKRIAENRAAKQKVGDTN